MTLKETQTEANSSNGNKTATVQCPPRCISVIVRVRVRGATMIKSPPGADVAGRVATLSGCGVGERDGGKCKKSIKVQRYPGKQRDGGDKKKRTLKSGKAEYIFMCVWGGIYGEGEDKNRQRAQ